MIDSGKRHGMGGDGHVVFAIVERDGDFHFLAASVDPALILRRSGDFQAAGVPVRSERTEISYGLNGGYLQLNHAYIYIYEYLVEQAQRRLTSRSGPSR